MAFFKKIVDALSADRTPYEPALSEFPQVDASKLIGELRLRKRGTERGRKDQPPQTQESFDEIEQEIAARFQHFYNAATDCLRNNTEVYEARLARFANSTTLFDVEQESLNAMANFKADVIDDADHLFIAKHKVLESEEEYAAFRKDNRLRRTAKYPEHTLKNFSIIFFFCIVETIANAVFFSQTHPSGWLGAGFESIFISVVNSVGGVGFGWLVLRGLNAPNWFLRGLCFLLMIAGLAAFLAFNGFAAHYRDAFSSIPPEILASGRDAASTKALEFLLANQYLLAGFQSYLMVCIGMIVVGISAYEGYGLDDPYPGFGRTARQRDRLANEYAEEKSTRLEGLKERKDDALNAIDDIIDGTRRRQEEQATVLAALPALAERYDGFVNHLEDSAKFLLETYRSANRAARTVPPPLHFDAAWSPGWVRASRSGDQPEGLQAKTISELIEELKKAREAFLSAYSESVEKYQMIDQIVSKEELVDARTKIR